MEQLNLTNLKSMNYYWMSGVSLSHMFQINMRETTKIIAISNKDWNAIASDKKTFNLDKNNIQTLKDIYNANNEDFETSWHMFDDMFIFELDDNNNIIKELYKYYDESIFLTEKEAKEYFISSLDVANFNAEKKLKIILSAYESCINDIDKLKRKNKL